MPEDKAADRRGDRPENPVPDIILVTGMSGAGRSTALKVLEDLGFEAIDNLPLALLPRITAGQRQLQDAKPLAVGVDVRSRDFSPELLESDIAVLTGELGLNVRTLFLDCEDAVLIRRYAETRRKHPLAADRPVGDGLELERRILAPMREAADLVVDTTDLTIWELKQRLSDAFRMGGKATLAITVASFSYRRGLPRDADLVFDVRFFANPHYDPDLREKTGRDEEVGAYIAQDPDYDDFWARLTGLLEITLPRYEREGKSYLTVTFGCTGGKHRSVHFAERLAAWLREKGWSAGLTHRDLANRDIANRDLANRDLEKPNQ